MTAFPMQGASVGSQIGELISHMPHGMAWPNFLFLIATHLSLRDLQLQDGMDRE